MRHFRSNRLTLLTGLAALAICAGCGDAPLEPDVLLAQFDAAAALRLGAPMLEGNPDSVTVARAGVLLEQWLVRADAQIEAERVSASAQGRDQAGVRRAAHLVSYARAAWRQGDYSLALRRAYLASQLIDIK